MPALQRGRAGCDKAVSICERDAMKLSEAIRAGAKMRPQTRGTIFSRGKSCAIGAALEGSGLSAYRADVDNDYYLLSLARTSWPWATRVVAAPIKGMRDSGVLNVVWRLNDNRMWSREAIAEWVEVEERKAGLWNDNSVRSVPDVSDVSEPAQEEVPARQYADSTLSTNGCLIPTASFSPVVGR